MLVPYLTAGRDFDRSFQDTRYVTMVHYNTQQSENLLSKLIDHANVLVIYIDNDGHVSICNRKVEDITGKTKSDIVGRKWGDILFNGNNPAIKEQVFRAVIEDSINYKRLNSFEGMITDTKNNERLISWSINPILSGKEDLDGVLFIGNDITELREKGESLRRIEDTLREIFSSIKDYALYVTNLDGNITYYGMGSEKMFGWSKNEVVFKHASVLFAQDYRDKLSAILDQVRNTGQYDTEVNLVKKDGQSFPVILTVNQFRDSQGTLTGFTFIAKDITERKKMEYQIFQAEKLAAIGQLAAGMAHEINNPLFVISGRLEMLLEEEGLDEKTKSDLKIIASQADRIRRLVDGILKFSRQSQLKLERINVNEVIESVLPFLSYHKLSVTNISIEKEMDKDLPAVIGDLNQLQEVFVNLFMNAYQAMSSGGKLRIETKNLDGRIAEIRISDTGPGIRQENLKNIFMPFFSTKKDGTGLGLSICYNIIKTHNGSIDIETQENKGTAFVIKLPFA